MRTLHFQIIVDSQFHKDLNHTFAERMQQLRNALRVPDVELITNTCRDLYFEGGIRQIRADCYVKKGKGITWNQIYGMVNSVKAVPFRFV